MRWEQLFADLEAQYDELEEAQLQAELAERQRIEFGGVGMVARLAGSVDSPVRLRTTGGTAVSGILRRLGPDWVLIGEAPGREAVVSLAAVSMVEGLTAATGQPLGAVAGRLTLRSALRGVARDRSPVSVTLLGSNGGPDAGTGTDVTGTIDRVGADFLELALHAAWEPRRAGSVRRVVLVPLAAVIVVRAQPMG
ncbi:hypothetical protein [Nakamurella lactea]|uniref:hypothetical protein n=1 Tax=Nakamurella lactea TaxID=459515 RepID=UPI000409F3C8|nr:hypothetical protein [Nakamurella lactea]